MTDQPQPSVSFPPGMFSVADFGPAGDLRSNQPYTYALLEKVPGALDLLASFSMHLYRTPESFETTIDLGERLTLRFLAPAPTAGLGTLRCDGALISLSLLATGLDPQADDVTLNALQKHLLRELRDTPHEPAFSLLSIPQRPLLATLVFADPPTPRAQHLAAIADRCLAASFFRYHGLS
jgi:hypothetical protein